MAHYFDYAAATPIDKRVIAAMEPYFSEKFYNPSAIYLDSQNIKKDLNEARSTIARLCGAKSTEIIFTAGGTEANNLAIVGVLNQYPGSSVAISAIEHDSVRMIAAEYPMITIPVSSKGRILFEDLNSVITDNTVLISCMLVNNEVGTIQDINELVEKVNEIRIKRKQDGNKLPLYVHTDACQAVNYLDISVSRLGVDLLTINSGKIYGPKQCGALFIKSGIILKPIIYGGGQEKGLRSGTENIANCIGFAKALEIADKKRAFESKRLIDIRDKMIQEFKANDIQVNGAKGSKRIANNVHITIEGYDNERLLMELDIRGFMVATGSACSASSDLPSHVLKALGFSDDQSRSSIRITLGRNTDEHSAMQLVQNVIELVAKK